MKHNTKFSLIKCGIFRAIRKRDYMHKNNVNDHDIGFLKKKKFKPLSF